MNAFSSKSGGARQNILTLTIKDKKALYSAYMSFIKNGGLFIPTVKPYQIGDEVFILMTLMEDAGRVPVAGRVVWITPGGAEGNRPAGIGVQFNDNDGGKEARNKIEAILAGGLQSEAATHTM